MSRFVKHIPCEACGSSDANALYRNDDGGEYTFCFACPPEHAHRKAGDREEDRGEPAINDTGNLDAIGALPARGDSSRSLSEWAMAHYGVRCALSTSDGSTVVSHYYPYTRGGSGDIVAYKHRELPKTFRTVGNYHNLCLFGQRQALNSGGKRLFITEGELDAVALYQALKLDQKGTQWEHLTPAVVSIGFGSSAAVRAISGNLEFVNRFEDVILCFDQDDAGQRAVAEVLKLLPTAKVASFDGKDANDMVMRGKNKELIRSVLFNAQRIRPAHIATVDDIMERALAKPTMGLSWPWPTLTKETYGIHTKKLYGLGAGVGMGKSEWNKEVQSHLLYTHDQKIGIFMLEEDAGRTVKALAGKRVEKQFHRPDDDYDENELRPHIEAMREKLFLYDHFGGKDWKDVKSAIRYMVVTEGIKWVFVDPMTALASHMSASAANDQLNLIFSEAAGMTHELDFSIFYSSHLNLPDHGAPHEQGGEPLESQMTGSRAALRWSHYIMMLKGDKSPELSELERNTRTLICRKDREFGSVFKFPIYYNKNTGVFREPEITY